jgi:hypothetical protein
MSSSVKQGVRYWGFLFLKCLLAGGISIGLFALQSAFWPMPHGYDTTYMLYLFVFSFIGLIGIGLFYVAILDQRYRCRVCLRRLRMPVLTGSWSKMMLFGRPQTQYICLYGHGKLDIPELHFTGVEETAWTEHGDYWSELCGTGEETGKRP